MLGYFKEQGFEVTAVSFTYGSKHNKYENEAARQLAKHYGIKIMEIDLSGVFSAFESDLLLTGGDIPEGHYEGDNMKSTVVPSRNFIFISILTGLAESLGIFYIGAGVHAGDHAIYPDCRPRFIDAVDKAIYYASEDKVRILTPLLLKNKTDIIELGTELGVPFELTRTCYKDQPAACGKCGSCQERLEAFKNLALNDPVIYDHEPMVKPLTNGVDPNEHI